MDARTANFDDGGTIDPFTGLAPALTPEEEQRRLEARQAQLRAAATRTANINNAPGGYGSQRAAGDQEILDSSNKRAAEHRAANPRHTLFGALIRDPVTMGVLAAPAAITGLGAAIGGGAALGFGLGEGSIAGAPAAGLAAESAPFTMASPFAAGAGGGGAATGGAAATGAAAATPTLGGMIASDLGAIAPVAAAAAGPALIQQLAGGRTKEEKQLLAKQEQMAAEAKVRQGQQQDARMNMLGQQLLAFNPRNQMMAQMFGPQAAFTPEAMAQMAQGPAPAFDQEVGGYTGTDPKKLAEQHEMIRRLQEYQAAEAARREMLMNGIQQPGPGPAPIQMPTP